MTDIQFSEEPQYARPSIAEEKPFFINLVIKMGIVDNVRSANYILLGFAVLMFCLSIGAYFLFNGNQETETLSEIDIELMNRQ